MNLYGSDKYDGILQRKPYPPGKSPKARLERLSEYGKQLAAKQRARDIYGLSEKQFHGLFQEAMSMKGQTGDSIKQLLERRLDNLLYRAGFARTRVQARQMASHGLFMINGLRVTLPSYRVRPGLVVSVRPQKKNSPVFEAFREKKNAIVPSWLRLDAEAMTVEVTGMPSKDDGEQAIDMRQVLEFYSRK